MWASALVSAIAVMTSATIQARLRVTFVDIMLAVVASKSWGTDACEGIDAIYTGSTVEARTANIYLDYIILHLILFINYIIISCLQFILKT